MNSYVLRTAWFCAWRKEATVVRRSAAFAGFFGTPNAVEGIPNAADVTPYATHGTLKTRQESQNTNSYYTQYTKPPRTPYKIIISGGGTGGHIFPAISIANELRRRFPDAELLFIGAEDRMEMERIPAAGYKILGLPVSGFNRAHKLKNASVIIKLARSLHMARKIIRHFKPDIAIGVGGYASGPTLWMASSLRIPILIQEQNSYAGVTNRLLAGRASKICVAYRGMNKFFPAKRIIITGNPVRKDIENIHEKTPEAMNYFGLETDKPVLLIVGGSLGARTVNRGVHKGLQSLLDAGIQVIWQTGRYYYDSIKETLKDQNSKGLRIADFISRMDYAYAAADLVISRAGAGTISELCLLKKAAILVPSPNVAEDHQTKNARALSDNKAALLIPDDAAEEQLIPAALKLIRDTKRLQSLSDHITLFAQHDSAERIVDEVVRIIAPVPAARQMNLRDISSAYFIGAGGIGMSALIRYFLAKGKRVAGYDRTPSALTGKLQAEGVAIHFDDDGETYIPEAFRDKNTTLVVYTPAVPDSHSELTYFRRNGFEVLKRSQTLGLITGSSRGLCVAGTHGKTTTSSMIAHLLKQSSVDCNAFLGGILKNYDSNLMLSPHSDLTVIEADEYDRSFHFLTPCMAVVTSADPDHLDIYGTPQAYRESFEKFTSLIRPGGTLIMKKGIDVTPDLQQNVKFYTYSATDETADFHAAGIRTGNGELLFDFVSPELRIADIRLGVPVRTNVENGIAAMAVALLNGVTAEEMRAAMESFAGAQRRFDFQVKNKRVVYIDDYAHHPQELRSCIQSVKELYRDRKVTGVFQPHLYTRTRDFADEFASALSCLDRLILLDIYPAREEPIPGITSEMILDKVTIPDKTLCRKEELLKILEKEDTDVLLTLGAGDIDNLVEPIRNMLNNKYV